MKLAVCCSVAVLFAASVPLRAAADTFGTFALSNVTLLSGATAGGTVTIDLTSGTVQSENVTAVEKGLSYTFTTVQSTVNTLHDTYWDSFDTAGDEFELSVRPLTLVGYMGGALCEVSTSPGNCPDENYATNGDSHAGFFAYTPGYSGGNVDFIAQGSLVPVPTPEPGTLILTLTGAFAAVGAGYSRYARLAE